MKSRYNGEFEVVSVQEQPGLAVVGAETNPRLKTAQMVADVGIFEETFLEGNEILASNRAMNESKIVEGQVRIAIQSGDRAG